MPPSVSSPCVLFLALLVATGCAEPDPDRLKIGVAFDTLQTEYWVAGYEALRADLARRGIDMIEAIADNDSNRQLDQIHAFIARQVDGIIVAPKDAMSVVPMIHAANRSRIPIVIYNRPPSANDGHSVTVVADNYQIAKATVTYMAEKAKASGKHYKAMILIGDLGDINAIQRRDGFDAAVSEYQDILEVVARVPTEWSQEIAYAGVTNSLQIHPDINFIFTSSDFLFSSLVSALKNRGKYAKIGKPNHVLLGGFDGDSTAYRMLEEGYLDADGVQDVYFECAASLDAVLDLRQGKKVASIIQDPGFVIHQGNLAEKKSLMWGSQVAK